MVDTAVVLVTGATGYIGGRLVPRLLADGHSVRVLVRDHDRLQGRAWRRRVEVAQGDVLDPTTLPRALAGVHTAYYLIHSMLGGEDFHVRDLAAARNFGRAARAAGVHQIIYLGGLGDPDADLSAHLRSRQQVGDALRESEVLITEFRAAVIVGSESVSFQMVRTLTDRLPIMICPRWVFSRVQPIAIDDVLRYLTAALDTPESAGRVLEIGGSDVLTYGEMMLAYARVRGLRRVLIAVPFLTPRLSSYWVHWVTPIPAAIARPLIEGLRNEVIVRDDSARTLFPQIQPMGYRAAVKLACAQTVADEVETTWSDALASSRRGESPATLNTDARMFSDRRELVVHVPPSLVWREFTRLGGAHGWLYANRLWQLRGMLDRAVGGVGLRRGRRHPDKVYVGDAIDFWRVEAMEPDHLLRLRAEMKVPGKAWLQFEVTPRGREESVLRQTALFAPTGLPGLLYWYVLYPIHVRIFSGMAHALARRAEAAALSRQAVL